MPTLLEQSAEPNPRRPSLAAVAASTDSFLYSLSVEQLQEASLADITGFGFAQTGFLTLKLHWSRLPGSDGKLAALTRVFVLFYRH